MPYQVFLAFVTIRIRIIRSRSYSHWDFISNFKFFWFTLLLSYIIYNKRKEEHISPIFFTTYNMGLLTETQNFFRSVDNIHHDHFQTPLGITLAKSHQTSSKPSENLISPLSIPIFCYIQYCPVIYFKRSFRKLSAMGLILKTTLD